MTSFLDDAFQGSQAPILFCMWSTRNVSHGEGLFLSAKDQSFQARYMEPAV